MGEFVVNRGYGLGYALGLILLRLTQASGADGREVGRHLVPVVGGVPFSQPGLFLGCNFSPATCSGDST